MIIHLADSLSHRCIFLKKILEYSTSDYLIIKISYTNTQIHIKLIITNMTSQKYSVEEVWFVSRCTWLPDYNNSLNYHTVLKAPRLKFQLTHLWNRPSEHTNQQILHIFLSFCLCWLHKYSNKPWKNIMDNRYLMYCNLSIWNIHFSHSLFTYFGPFQLHHPKSTAGIHLEDLHDSLWEEKTLSDESIILLLY